MVGKGHAGICHSCQQDILKQEYQDVIFCENCRTEWSNTNLKHKKAAAYESMGMPCYACSKGMLVQQWANIISCNTCGTSWRAWRLKGYSKRQQFKQDMSQVNF